MGQQAGLVLTSRSLAMIPGWRLVQKACGPGRRGFPSAAMTAHGLLEIAKARRLLRFRRRSRIMTRLLLALSLITFRAAPAVAGQCDKVWKNAFVPSARL